MNNHQFNFLIANITWNSYKWEIPSKDPSNFQWVKDHPKSYPGESWNFNLNFEKPIKFGFFQFRKDLKPAKFKNGGVIFFFSKNTHTGENFIVGFRLSIF